MRVLSDNRDNMIDNNNNFFLLILFRFVRFVRVRVLSDNRDNIFFRQLGQPFFVASASL